MYVCMSIMPPFALLIISGRRAPPLCGPSPDFFRIKKFFLALCGGLGGGGPGPWP